MAVRQKMDFKASRSPVHLKEELLDPNTFLDALGHLPEAQRVQIKTTVRYSLLGGGLAGGSAVAGGMLGGTLGLVVGGLVGSLVGGAVCGLMSKLTQYKFKPLPVILKKLTDEQKRRLYIRVLASLGVEYLTKAALGRLGLKIKNTVIPTVLKFLDDELQGGAKEVKK